MLRKIALTSLFYLPYFSFAQNAKFEIEGTLQRSDPASVVYLSYSVPGQMILDSSKVIDGKFAFKGTANTGEKAYLQMRHSKSASKAFSNDYLSIYLDAGKILVNGDNALRTARVTGTPSNELEQELRQKMLSFDTQEKSLETAYKAATVTKDSNQMKAIGKRFFNLDTKRKNTVDEFIVGHKDNYIAFITLKSYVDPNAEPDRAIRLLDQLDSNVSSTKGAKVYASFLTNARIITIGKHAPLFSAKTPSGETVSLSDFKGKYVLIDFWASWCMPCRADNPSLVKVYNKYKNQKFEILGVSLDGGVSNVQQWKSAITNDQLTWPQISDLNGWDSPIAKQYNIKSIPANVLIDANGKIIAKNLHGEALEEKLAELF